MTEKYSINKIFYSLQGEGIQAGRPAVFVRFAGCNLRCDFCDTDFSPKEQLTAKEIFRRVMLAGGRSHAVIFTGGEPMLQLDWGLLKHFKEPGQVFWTAIETNGTQDIKAVAWNLNWITVSPKPGAKIHDSFRRIQMVDELKIPIRAGDTPPSPPPIPARHYLLSPIFNGNKIVPANVEWALKLCLKSGFWCMTIQHHKLWGIH